MTITNSGIVIGSGMVTGSGVFSITLSPIPSTGPIDVTLVDSAGNQSSSSTILT